MQTLADRFNKSYQDFDLSDDTFKYSRLMDWRYYVPDEIIDNWKILQIDERYLIALTANHAASLDD